MGDVMHDRKTKICISKRTYTAEHYVCSIVVKMV